jgi:hypothetical protein
VTDLNAQQSTRGSNIELVFYGLLIAASGSTGILFGASQVSRALGVLSMIISVAVVVTGCRARSRQQRTHSIGVNLICIGLLALNANVDRLFDSDRRRRMSGIVVVILGVATLVWGGLQLRGAQTRKA